MDSMTSMTAKFGKDHGSAAIIDPGRIANVPAMAAVAAAGPHEPAGTSRVQAMYLSDSEECADSPLLAERFRTPPRRRPGKASPLHKRLCTRLRRVKPPTVEAPHEQDYMKKLEALTRRVDKVALEAVTRNRVEKWHSENTDRILDLENRVNIDFKEAKGYINEKFGDATTRIQVQEGHLNALDAKIEQQRGDLKEHKEYLRKIHDLKPGEEQTLYFMLKTLNDEILKINATKMDQESVLRMFHEIEGNMKDLNQNVRQDFGNIQETLAKKIEEVTYGLAQTAARLDIMSSAAPPVPVLPEGYERATRWRSPPQQSTCDPTCGNKCNGKGHGDQSTQWKGKFEDNWNAWGDRSNGGRGDGGRGDESTANMGNMDGKSCHCDNVRKLIDDMNDVRLDVGRLQAARIPLVNPGARRDGEGPPSGAPERNYGSGPSHAAPPETPSVSMSLPLSLGPLGTLSSGRIFDDRVATQSDFAFKGIKQGYAWKTKAVNYMISKVPAMKQILHWAEREENAITPERLQHAIGTGLCVYDRDGNATDHTKSLDSAVWGFLSNCTSAEAEVMFKQAEVCEGIDAWRRIIRLLDNGRSIRFEQLRNEIRMIRAYPIKTLEAVTVGVAEYENKINDFVEAGGRRPPEDELKSVLNAILPNELGNHLTVRVTDHNLSYQQFRDFVVYTCAQLLMRNKRLPPIHHIDEGDGSQEGYGARTEEGFIDPDDYEGLLAAVNGHWKGRKGGGKGGARRPGPKGSGKGKSGVHAVDADTRNVRRCTNCGGEHDVSACTKQAVDRDQRPCWTCNKTGHVSANCPNKKAPIKSVVEQDANKKPLFAWNVNDPEDNVDIYGFKTVQKGGRPRPQSATMGMLLTNAFASLGAMDEQTAVEEPRRANKKSALRSGDPWEPPLTSCLAKPQAATSMGAPLTRHSSKFVNLMFPTFNDDIQHEMQQVESMMMLEEQIDELNIIRDTTTVKVAMDSGAVKHVTHPSTLPSSTIINPNQTGRHFSGASGETIEKYGDCMTTMTTKTGTEIAMPWNVADVARPLHAVSQVTGPADHPVGKHDVLFNNKRCVVVEPGVVEYILQRVKPIAEYVREGDLYLAEMQLSAFGRQGQKQ